MDRENYKLSFLYSSKDNAVAPEHASATGTVPLCELTQNER
jgi:hypothetical protein